MNFEEFLVEWKRRGVRNFNLHLKQPGFHILYMRVGPRAVGASFVEPAVTIATVESITKSKGTFRRFVLGLRAKHPDFHIFVEAANPRLGRGLLRMGFRSLETSTAPEVCDDYYLAVDSPLIYSRVPGDKFI